MYPRNRKCDLLHFIMAFPSLSDDDADEETRIKVCVAEGRVCRMTQAIFVWSSSSVFNATRGGPCQHGFMCGCKQWSTPR